MATLSGEPLYTAYGFRAIERLEDATGGAAVPIVRMEKPVDAEVPGVKQSVSLVTLGVADYDARRCVLRGARLEGSARR